MTGSGFFQRLREHLQGEQLDLEDVEAALLQADLGPSLTEAILAELQKSATHVNSDRVIELAREKLLRRLQTRVPNLQPFSDRPKTWLVVGVNGSGKTTTVAKLAYQMRQKNYRVVLAAADTFRAGAIEQLQQWGEWLQADVVAGQYGADPAAVCFDAWMKASKQKADFLLCDTAGRLHTKTNLMHQLAKVKRALTKQDPTAPHETFLVIDATTGGNAVKQAKEFHQAIGLTGIILTKLDGSGRGGAVVAIQEQVGLPTVYVGVGESHDDLRPFKPTEFVQELL